MKLEVSKSELFLPVELFVSLERAQSLVLLIIFSGEGSKLNNSANVSNLFFKSEGGWGCWGTTRIAWPKKTFFIWINCNVCNNYRGPSKFGQFGTTAILLIANHHEKHHHHHHHHKHHHRCLKFRMSSFLLKLFDSWRRRRLLAERVKWGVQLFFPLIIFFNHTSFCF